MSGMPPSHDPEWYQKFERLFHAAMERKGEERYKFLVENCASDESMLEELLAQIAVAEQGHLLSGLTGLDDFRAIFHRFTEELFSRTLGTPEPSPLRPGAMIEHYQLIRGLGRGGMGVVYLARDTRLGRRVAIKFLSNNNQLVSQRFLAEARLTARCKHDNIVDIYDIGQTRGHSYMVLEYLQGVTLRAWLRDRWQSDDVQGEQHAQVSPTLAVEMITLVVRALVHAHAQGLVHRDLKPENIMLAEDGSVKVLDFGIAKVLHEVIASHESSKRWAERGFQTRSGALVGTKPYMSPEQWGAGDIDARTDVWAIGLLLWEMCTGYHPLDPLSPERVQSIRDVDVPMPSLAEKHPEIGPLASVVDCCLRKHAHDRLPSARALLEELKPMLPIRGRGSLMSAGEPVDPFVGLAAFQRIDAERFFGRDLDIAKLTTQLRNHRLVTVVGPSGAGKSSFIRAGVIPALERSGQIWESLIIRPGRRPLASLANILSRIGRQSSDNRGEHLSDDIPDFSSLDTLVGTLHNEPGYLGTVLRERCDKRSTRILLFVDQFEELYTLGADRDIREAFVRCLEGVADDSVSPLRVLLSLRSDLLDRVAEDRTFTNEIIRGMVLLSPLSRDQLRAVLTEPLSAVGYEFEGDEMVEGMLDALQETRSPLPLLQFTASRLWEARDKRRQRISHRSYKALGGIEGALAQHADAVIAGLSVSEQRLARLVCTRLVTDERTRAIVSMDEIRASVGAVAVSHGQPKTGNSDGILDGVVRHLAAARLVLMGTDSERGVTVELIHGSLIERWPKLVQWLEEGQDVAQICTRLRAAARQWDKSDRSEDLLWRGQTARDAMHWLDLADTALGGLGRRDRAFLEAVVGLFRRRQRLSRLLWAVGTSLVIAIVIAVSFLAVRANREAKQARESALWANNASRMASAGEFKQDATLVLALVREIEPADQLPPRWRELARWATHQHIAPVVSSHPDAVHSAVFSPDGNRVVTAAADKLVRIWNADGTGLPLILEGHRDYVYKAVFSPDGTRVVTASRDRTARIWKSDGTGTPIVLSGHGDFVIFAAFSPDGSRVVTASRDRTARVWRSDGTDTSIVLRGHTDMVLSALFSPDGERIVTASRDKTARVWNADGTGTPIVLRGHGELIQDASFSPDGERIVTASRDKTARVWNADGIGTPIVLRGHQKRLSSARFSPDGTRIVTGSWDHTIRVWNADGTGMPLVIRGHRDGVSSAAFSPDGTRVVSASWDKTMRIWPVTGDDKPVRLRGHEQLIYSAAFSPDGTRVVTASRDKTARVWNVDGTGEPVIFRGHEKAVYSAVFCADGSRIVTASGDKTVRIWNADGTETPIILRGQEMVFSAVFNPDCTRILTASRERVARVWSVDGSGPPLSLVGHDDLVYSAAFSPDGTQIVTTSFDNTVRLWDGDSAVEQFVLHGHQHGVYTAAFSPDGTRLVTASADKTARVWHLDRRQSDGTLPFVELRGHEAGVRNAGTRGGQGAFSPDGMRLVTISNDRTLRVWRADGTGEPALLQIPEIDARSAAFSPDGTHIVTASHSGHDPLTSKMEHWVTVWPSFERFSSISDTVLWMTTRYCPPVELRIQLLGVSDVQAAREFKDCQARVAATWGDKP